MSASTPTSRRRFLQRLGALGLAGLGSGTLLAACGGGSDAPAEAPAASSDVAAGEFTCTDVTGLTEQEIQMRNSLQYVDNSPYPEKLCKNCEFWQPEGATQCGGCQLIKGPIHPMGYCTSWVAMQSA